jgi:hypothetical protein
MTGGGIGEMPAYLEVEQALGTTGVQSIAHKLTIGDHDVYAHIGWHRGRPCWVDLTITHNSTREGSCQSSEANDLATRMIDDARAAMEVICRQASALLQADVWTIDNLIGAWRGTKFQPCGVCDQVKGIVSSPLDAVARLLEVRGLVWASRTSVPPAPAVAP